MAPHPARDGGRGGDGGRGARKPKVKVPPPRQNLGPKLAQLARNENGGAHLPPWTPPAAVSALLRVWRELPELQRHAPLGAIVATNAPLPDASQGAEALREAAATELARCRRAFLEGAPLPRAHAPDGAEFPAHAVHTALLVDATAGEDGIMGRDASATKTNDAADGVFTAADESLAGHRRGPPPPPASALDASAMSPAYSRMFRSGAIAEAVLRALRLPPDDLCAPPLCNGVRISTSAGTRRGGAGGAAPAADFGIRRCDERHLEKQNDVLGDLSSGASVRSLYECGDRLEWPAGEFVTRHVTVTNTGVAPVLIVAVVCVPEMRGAFRVRCDHPALSRHSGDRDPPGSVSGSAEGAGEDGPVALFPGASYEVSVDFRAEGRRDTPGHVAQWVLFATVECPVGWKTGDGFPARARTRDVDSVSLDDDDDDEDDTDVDSRDVRVAGCRAVAVVLRGSRERRREVATMMLNPETPKFVPKRLREAFDELPRALVSPPAHLLGFDSEPDPFAGVAPQSASSLESDSSSPTLERFMSVHPSVLASASTPAAYLGPDGALCPRAFFRVTQDGAREGAVAFEDAAQWRFSSPIVAKWARTIAVEERRQALDIRRYDLHDAVFAFAGRTPRALPGQHYDTYALDVPGLLEGYPPVAPLDVLKLRLTRTGGGRDELSLGSRYFGAVAGGAGGRGGEPGGLEGSNFDFHVTDHRCVVRRGGGRGKRPGGWRGSYGVDDAADSRARDMNDAVLDAGVPLDVGTEVCVTVFRVVPRKALVLVAFPPCVSRTLRGDPRVAIRAHVRFAQDVNAFKTQRAALLAAQANPATLAMLQPYSPASRSRPFGGSKTDDDDAPSTLEAFGGAGVTEPPSPFPFTRRVVAALRARLNDEQWRVVRDVCAGHAAVADGDGAPLGPPYCAFGPPGTGKTVTVVAAVVAVLATQPDARVLVCAPAPFAADVACARLADLTAELRRDFSSGLRENAAAGDGDDAPPPALEPFVSSTRKNYANEKRETPSADAERDWTMVRVNDPRRDPASVKSDVSRFCAARGSEAEAALHARVVVASCASAGFLADSWATPTASDAKKKTRPLSSHAFTHVFVDEAGQATVPETLVPLRMTSASQTRAVVLAGDPKQLGPVVHAASARALRESLLASAVGTHEAEARGATRSETHHARRRLVKLTRNYRSHADIFGLSSALFYDNALVAAAPAANVALPASLVGEPDDDEEPRSLAGTAGTAGTENSSENSENSRSSERSATKTSESVTAGQKSRPARVLFVGVRGVQTREGTGEAPSFFNAMEAQTLVDVLADWLWLGDARDAKVASGGGAAPARYADASADASLRLRTCDVGVIAPYRAQVVRLRTLLRARGLGAVRVGTVDDYQGQEEKVMFISTVASRGPPATPTTNAKSEFSEGDVSSDPRLGFLACPRRFNVAVTRAKALNVIVGHPVALERWTHWKALLRHCLARGAYVGEGALAADLGARRGPRGRSFLPSAPSSTRDEKHTPLYADGHAFHDDGGASATREGDGRKATDDDDDDEYEALASAIARVAETSLLGGGDADAMFPDFEVGTSFGDHQSWKVAL